jgi:hypothetical protein
VLEPPKRALVEGWPLDAILLHLEARSTVPTETAAMKNHYPHQLELFSDGARAVAAGVRPKPPRPTEADLQAKLDATCMRS